MNIKKYNLEFSERLREIMLKKGYGSCSAAHGVSPIAISKAIGCYNEMSLRYLDGRSVPTPEIALKIAEWLEISPAYLLYGEAESTHSLDNKIFIDKDIIEYTLKKMIPLIKKSNDELEIISFFNSLLSDVSLINMENDELKKVVDLAIKSTAFFNDKITIGSKINGSINADCQAAS
jgi:transcriptional regulator with XRE-family HTH domain